MSPEFRLIEALRAVVQSHNATTVRDALALIEELAPSPDNCPKCDHPGAIKRGTVRVHFAKVTDARPCPASFRNTAGGILL